MIGAMKAQMVCLPNRKTMMMKLMKSWLENMMKSKVIKNITTNQYPQKKLSKKKPVPGSVTKFLT